MYDSEIAAKYPQHATKARYVIVYGLAPHVKEAYISNAKDTLYCYKSDETTTSQVKKQYDGYITFFSKYYNQVVTVAARLEKTDFYQLKCIVEQ